MYRVISHAGDKILRRSVKKRFRTIVGELSIVSVYQPGAGEPTLLGREQDPIHRAEEARVVGRDEEHQWRDQDGGVQHGVVLVALDERVHLLVVSYLRLPGQ